MFPYLSLEEGSARYVNTIDATVPASESEVSGHNLVVPDGGFL